MNKLEIQEFKKKWLEILEPLGAKHIPPIPKVWVKKFINRYLSSNKTIDIKEDWDIYLRNKRGNSEWEFFVCCVANIQPSMVNFNSKYHPVLSSSYLNRSAMSIIEDYAKEHDLIFKEQLSGDYELGFYRRKIKNS